MILIQAEKLKEVAALKTKIKALETDKNEACQSLQQKCSQLSSENVTLKTSLKSKESELKNHQGSNLIFSILR
jgi:cell shape-determining protein MreC